MKPSEVADMIDNLKSVYDGFEIFQRQIDNTNLFQIRLVCGRLDVRLWWKKDESDLVWKPSKKGFRISVSDFLAGAQALIEHCQRIEEYDDVEDDRQSPRRTNEKRRRNHAADDSGEQGTL